MEIDDRGGGAGPEQGMLKRTSRRKAAANLLSAAGAPSIGGGIAGGMQVHCRTRTARPQVRVIRTDPSITHLGGTADAIRSRARRASRIQVCRRSGRTVPEISMIIRGGIANYLASGGVVCDCCGGAS